MRTQDLTRRTFLGSAVALSLAASTWAAAQQAKKIEVWKDPNCGCCKDWVAHLEKNGFKATVYETGNAEKRAQLGLADKFGSCHTALVDGYVIEGHVPAADIQRLLKQKPSALGLAVPGMPIGSPGMDGALYGGRKDPFNVLLVQRNGTSSVFNFYG